MSADTLIATQRDLPSVNDLLADAPVASMLSSQGRGLVLYAVRQTLQQARGELSGGRAKLTPRSLIRDIRRRVAEISEPSLIPVINATGVVIHTNLGRAPLSVEAAAEVARVAVGYCNLEFSLSEGDRGSRLAHVRALLSYLTGAEDVTVVNNNAAAIVLVLNVLVGGGDVIVSRGELIEIGGSFRIPDIMEAGGARMVEVGTTNRTRLADYAAAIGDRTRLLFKAHRSNFYQRGYVEDAGIAELAAL